MNIFIKAKKLAVKDKFEKSLNLLNEFPDHFLTSEICEFRGRLMQLVDENSMYYERNDDLLKRIKNEYLLGLKLNPNSADLHFELGMFYDVVMGDPINGLKHLKIAKEITENLLKQIKKGIRECG